MNHESLGSTHKPLREAVTDAIREAIVTGRYKPGERLYEDRIANELEVSRNPVRESLQALAAESFVELEPRRGARVVEIDRVRARELFEVRGSLEGLAAGLAAMRRTDTEVDALVDIVSSGGDAAARQSLDELPMLNTKFHDLLADMANNTMLTDTLGQLSGVIRWIYAERLQDRVDASWAEHRAIADAIADGHRDRAREVAEQHVAAARVAYLGD